MVYRYKIIRSILWSLFSFILLGNCSGGSEKERSKTYVSEELVEAINVDEKQNTQEEVFEDSNVERINFGDVEQLEIPAFFKTSYDLGISWRDSLPEEGEKVLFTFYTEDFVYERLEPRDFTFLHDSLVPSLKKFLPLTLKAIVDLEAENYQLYVFGKYLLEKSKKQYLGVVVEAGDNLHSAQYITLWEFDTDDLLKIHLVACDWGTLPETWRFKLSSVLRKLTKDSFAIVRDFSADTNIISAKVDTLLLTF